MNHVILSGRLTKNPELLKTTNGVSLSRFTLAVYDGKEKTQFLRCVVWDKLAESLVKNTIKGQTITVSGSLKRTIINEPNDRKDFTNVLVREVSFGVKPNATSTQNAEQGEAPVIEHGVQTQTTLTDEDLTQSLNQFAEDDIDYLNYDEDEVLPF